MKSNWSHANINKCRKEKGSQKKEETREKTYKNDEIFLIRVQNYYIIFFMMNL